MKNLRALTLAVMTLSTAAVFFSSCEREDLPTGADSKYVTLKVSTEKNVETKSVSRKHFETIDLSDKGVQLFLSGYQTVNNESPFEVTKASNPYLKDSVTSFSIRMVSPDGKVEDGIANRSSESADHWYIMNNGKKVEWSEASGDSHFLAFYPSTVNSFVSSNSVKFATDGQSDFLVASVDWAHKHSDYHNPATYVPLTFRHPLALVKFKVASDLGVTKITVNNAATTGTITDNGKSFSYASDSKGTLEATYVETLTDGTKTYSVYVMPEKIGADGINVTFYVGGQILTTANLGVESWAAGYIYNYRLSSGYKDGDVDIELSDDAQTIENVMTSAVYLRAAVVANWYDNNGRVAAAWDGKTNTLGSDSEWVLNKDGYYYHKLPVIGYDNTSASDLVAAIENTKTKAGLTIKVGVAVQAVEYDSAMEYAATAWGDSVKGILSKLN